MWILLGEPITALSEIFKSECKKRAQQVFGIAEFDENVEFNWEFGSIDSCSVLRPRELGPFSDREITGVFVQNPPRLDADNAAESHHEYSQTERNAAMFAWFWNLRCPVVNRYPAAFWFSPRVPLSCWLQLVIKCDLRITDAILSNVERDLRGFAKKLRVNPGYLPLCGPEAYRISTEEHWHGLSKMRAICPISVIPFDPPVYIACVVGDRVFWNRPLSRSITGYDDRLVHLTKLSGLDFLEVRLCRHSDDFAIHAIEPFPRLDGFGQDSCYLIADALIALLQSRGSAKTARESRRT
jgi:hypothetical protein